MPGRLPGHGVIGEMVCGWDYTLSGVYFYWGTLSGGEGGKGLLLLGYFVKGGGTCPFMWVLALGCWG